MSQLSNDLSTYDIDNFIAHLNIDTENYYKKMTTERLRNLCSSYGLTRSGNKEQLIYKLLLDDNTLELEFETRFMTYRPQLKFLKCNDYWEVYHHENGRKDLFACQIVKNDKLHKYISDWVKDKQEKAKKMQ